MWKPLALVILVFIRIKSPLYLTPAYEQLDMQHEGSIIIATWLFRRWAHHFNNHEWVERQRKQDKKNDSYGTRSNIWGRKVVIFFCLVMCPPAACDAAWNAEDIRVRQQTNYVMLCYVFWGNMGTGVFLCQLLQVCIEFHHSETTTT